MAGSAIVNNGKKIILNRALKATPDYTAPTVFKIGTGTTNPVVTNTGMETGVNINGGATKAFVSGYPTFDETSLTASIRCFLNSTEGNGNTLSEFGLFNTDGTAKMFSRSTHTPLSKSTSIEVTYVEKDIIK